MASIIKLASSGKTVDNPYITFDVAWTGANSIAADDGYSANVRPTSTGGSQFAVGVGYGFAIPSTAVITGVELVIKGFAAAINQVQFRTVTLFNTTDNTVIGTPKTPNTLLTTSNVVYTFGGPADLWGATLTPEIVNASSFGAAFATHHLNGYQQANVDYLQVRVTYTEGPTGTSVTPDVEVFSQVVQVPQTNTNAQPGARSFIQNAIAPTTIFNEKLNVGTVSVTQSTLVPGTKTGMMVQSGTLSVSQSTLLPATKTNAFVPWFGVNQTLQTVTLAQSFKVNVDAMALTTSLNVPDAFVKASITVPTQVSSQVLLTPSLRNSVAVPNLVVSQSIKFPSSSVKKTVVGSPTIISADPDWSLPNRVSSSNDSYATTVTSASGGELYAQGYFTSGSVPSNATITGVVVKIERKASAAGITDSNLKLTVGGNNKATATQWSTTEGVVSYGSSTDTWGVALTPAMINSNTFGVSYKVSGSGQTASIDWISIEVSYVILAGRDVVDVPSLGVVQTLYDHLGGLDGIYGPTTGSVAYFTSSSNTVNPTNALKIDNKYAQWTVTKTGEQNQLRIMAPLVYDQFVPDDAQIDGIEVVIRNKVSGVANTVYDGLVSLVLNGEIVGENKAKPEAWMTTADSTPYQSNQTNKTTYGSSIDSWGLQVTGEDLKNSGFGIAISANYTGANASASVLLDFASITIYYNTRYSAVLKMKQTTNQVLMIPQTQLSVMPEALEMVETFNTVKADHALKPATITQVQTLNVPFANATLAMSKLSSIQTLFSPKSNSNVIPFPSVQTQSHLVPKAQSEFRAEVVSLNVSAKNVFGDFKFQVPTAATVIQMRSPANNQTLDASSNVVAFIGKPVVPEHGVSVGPMSLSSGSPDVARNRTYDPASLKITYLGGVSSHGNYLQLTETVLGMKFGDVNIANAVIVESAKLTMARGNVVPNAQYNVAPMSLKATMTDLGGLVRTFDISSLALRTNASDVKADRSYSVGSRALSFASNNIALNRSLDITSRAFNFGYGNVEFNRGYSVASLSTQLKPSSANAHAMWFVRSTKLAVSGETPDLNQTFDMTATPLMIDTPVLFNDVTFDASSLGMKLYTTQFIVESVIAVLYITNITYGWKLNSSGALQMTQDVTPYQKMVVREITGVPLNASASNVVQMPKSVSTVVGFAPEQSTEVKL